MCTCTCQNVKQQKLFHSSLQHRVFLYVPSCTSYTHVQGVCECVMVNTHMTPGLGLHVAIVYQHVLHVLQYPHTGIKILKMLKYFITKVLKTRSSVLRKNLSFPFSSYYLGYSFLHDPFHLIQCHQHYHDCNRTTTFPPVLCGQHDCS